MIEELFFSFFSDGKKLVRIQLIVSERPVQGGVSAKIKLLIGVLSDRKIAGWKSSAIRILLNYYRAGLS